MVDQVIDDFVDNSGIDTINSTNELLETGYVRGKTIVGGTPTGGIVTTYGSTVVSTFLASGTFTVPVTGLVDVLVVAGGGGGGQRHAIEGHYNDGAGGGGGGGLLTFASQSLSSGSYTVTVGAGGASDTQGGNSRFGVLTEVIGGGKGGQGGYSGGSNAAENGGAGGSGGGGGGSTDANGGNPGGSATSGQGYAGGSVTYDGQLPAGGGGAGAIGTGAAGSHPHGGVGKSNSWRTGSGVYYAGGGGGGTNHTGYVGSGGNGGGGAGGALTTVGNAGSANSGGGGGGGGAGNASTYLGGDGGDGIVVIKYADDTFLQSSAGDLSLVSTATTAQTEPVTGDVVMLLEDGSGTATLNTDIKAHVSRDDGTTWTETTLTNEGSWGTDKKILVARDVDISSQPSGTDMRYKITTHNQSTTKETRIHATSLAWK
jgi:hypothetical protein